MSPEVHISVMYQRSDGVVVSRSVTVTQSMYSKSPVGDFKKNARRRALEAVNAVLGTPKGVVVDGA